MGEQGLAGRAGPQGPKGAEGKRVSEKVHTPDRYVRCRVVGDLIPWATLCYVSCYDHVIFWRSDYEEMLFSCFVPRANVDSLVFLERMESLAARGEKGNAGPAGTKGQKGQPVSGLAITLSIAAVARTSL